MTDTRIELDLKADDFQVENGKMDQAQTGITYTAEEVARVLRKCDYILLPLMGCSSAFSYIDKIALGNAATLTLKKDLHLVGNEYSLLTTVYFVALLIFQWPLSLALQRWHTGRVMAACMFCWGVVTLASMAPRNFAEMAALRFLLGVFEPGVVPGIILTTMRFYKPQEVPVRMACWTLANTLMPIPFSVIYYGLGKLPDHPLTQWRWIYVLLGIITIILSLLVLAIIPDQPGSCWWLNERQRAIIVQRVSETQMGQKGKFQWSQVREALTDSKAWLLLVAMGCQQSGASVVTNFSGQIIVGLGFEDLQALLLQIPGWVCSSGMILTVGLLSTYVLFFRTRKLLLMSVSCALAIASLSVLIVYPPGSKVNKGMQLFFISILNGHTGAYSGLVTLSGQNFAGTTKKATVVAMMLIGFGVSNMLVPLSFKSNEAPHYKTGITTVLSLLCLCLVCYITLYLIVRRENNRRDALAANDDGSELDTTEGADEDLTDKQNLKFRYLS